MFQLHRSYLLSTFQYCYIIGFIRLLLLLLFETTPIILINGQSINSLSNSPSDSLQPRSPIRKGYLIRLGQSLNLTCPGDAVFYQWNTVDQPSQILSEDQFYIIKSATLKDSNRYLCHAVHGYGRSSVEMSVRVIDFSSVTAQHECALDSKTGSVNINGPCFLTSLTERELTPTKSWGDHIIFDCDAVMGGTDGSLDNLLYTWEFISNNIHNNNNNLRSPDQGSDSGSDTSNMLHRQRLLVRTLSVASATVVSSSNSGTGNNDNSNNKNQKLDLSQFHDSQLRIDKLTLDHNGEYRCIVRTMTSNSQLPSPMSMTRNFRLTVKSRVDGPIIQGPRVTNETVEAGQDAIFHCQVNPEEHRSSTIRWGKSIDISERLAYEAEGREVIQWAGGTFVVLPSIPSSSLTLDKSLNSLSDTQSSSRLSSASSSLNLLSSGAVATEVSSTQSSQLVLKRVSQSDSGRYVCSVLTEAGRDDHKFVQISVIGGSSIQGHKLTGNSGTHRLTLYIAIPTTIFFICLCVVTYCLISRRTAHNRRISSVRHQRNYFSAVQQSQIKSSSAASSSSIGVCRNGINGHGGNVAGDNRLRPSPAGTALGATSMGYSPVNGGSNPMNGGNCPVGSQLSTPNFQVNLHGALPIVPGGYPVLIQSMGGSQPVSPFYSVPEAPGSLPVYGQNVSSVTTGINTGNNNNIGCYPNGLIYPISNGHVVNQNSSNLVPNSVFNSSPESSAAGINNSPGSNGNIEPVEGRLMFRPQPQLIGNYNTNNNNNNSNTNNTLRSYGYMPSGQSHISSSGINTSDYEMTVTNAPSSSLLSYPNHGNA